MADVVIFPIGKEASADAYLTFCNQTNPLTPAEWYPNNRVDKYGQRVVGYLGPTGFTFNGEPFPEPEGGPEARVDGVLNGNVEWPFNDD